jgi:death-on-curing protein
VRHLSIREVLELHDRILEQTGGANGVRDPQALESSLAQPHQTFDGEELYPSIPDKAAALGFFLVSNHPFVDGNKRIGHAALEVTLVLNGFELAASVAEQEQIMLSLASGTLSRQEFTTWVTQHLTRRT